MTSDAGAVSSSTALDAVPRGRGARRGIAALLSVARQELPDALEPVIRAHRAHHPRLDRAGVSLLGRAYQVAEASHRGQKRKSGEPFITHPLAVTMILAQLGAETTTLVASLLHDTVEDTDVTLDQVREWFGPEVAYLVDGVTKLAKVDFGAAAEAETFRKMLVATGNDVRVMVIKLADRLHNMRTLRHMKPASQVRIAKVTRDVLIPLAERLGVQVVKTELEDLVFSVLHPQEYAETRALAAQYEAEIALPEGTLQQFAVRLRRVLREARVQASVSVRPRHCVSVHRVRLARGENGVALAAGDLARVLVVVEENADCYAVLGELHTCWTPLPGEFKDFIAAPKFNLYQSLHTAVAVGEREQAGTVEVLVRTEQMHRVAEFGVAALSSVPTARAEGEEEADRADELDRTDPARPGWLERLLDWQRDTPDPDTFWSRLTADLSDDHELTVVTQDGRTLQLPAGADCVDAAYALGEQTGHRCIGARINGRLVALSTRLADGDVFEVLTESGRGEPTGPSPTWLSHARTPIARVAIERWLDAHAAAGEPGGEAPGAEAEAVGGRPHPVPDPGAAWPAAGPDSGGPRAGLAPAGRPFTAVRVEGYPRVGTRLARCCTPVPPDALVGFAIRGGAVAVHRADCPTAGGMVCGGRTALTVHWAAPGQAAAPCAAAAVYRATVHVEALGRPSLLAELTGAMSAAGVDIVAAAVEPPRELRVRHTYTVALPHADALPALMRAMLRVPGVYDVYRSNGRRNDRGGRGDQGGRGDRGDLRRDPPGKPDDSDVSDVRPSTVAPGPGRGNPRALRGVHPHG